MDRWTHRHNKANSRFHNSANAPKNEKFVPGKYYPESLINNRMEKLIKFQTPEIIHDEEAWHSRQKLKS